MAIAENNPASPLDIQVAATRGRHTLILSGELDLASAPHLQLLAMNICAAGARELVLDLSKMTFTDSTGVRTILGVQRVCRDHATGFLLTRPRPSVRRIFELAGLLDELPFVE
jgi:anti-anti-sigma factor